MIIIRGETLDNGNIKYEFDCPKCNHIHNYVNILPPLFCFNCGEEFWDLEQLQREKPKARLFYHSGWGPM